MRLAFSAGNDYQHDPADETESARDRRKSDPVTLLVRDLKWAYLGIFLLRRPTQTAPSKADEANNDEDDADNAGWFHEGELTMAAGLRSTE